MTFEEFCITPKDLIPPVTNPVISQDTKMKLEITTISFVLRDIYPIEALAAVKLFGRNCIEVISDGHPFQLCTKNLDELSDVTNRPGWDEYYKKNAAALIEYKTTIRVFLNGTNITNVCESVLARFFDPDTFGEGKEPKLLSDENIMTRVILPQIYKEAYNLSHTEDTHISGTGMWRPHKITDNPVSSVAVPDTPTGRILYVGNGVRSIDFVKGALDYATVEDFNTSGKDRDGVCKPAVFGKDYAVICAKLSLIDFIEMVLCIPPEITILDHDDISSVDAWGDSVFDGVDPLKRMYALPVAAKIDVLIKVNMRDVEWVASIRKYNWADAITPLLDAMVKAIFKNKRGDTK